MKEALARNWEPEDRLKGFTKFHFGTVASPASTSFPCASLGDLPGELDFAGLGVARAPRCQPGTYRGPSGQQGDWIVRYEQYPQPLTGATAMLAPQSSAPALSRWTTGLERAKPAKIRICRRPRSHGISPCYWQGRRGRLPITQLTPGVRARETQRPLTETASLAACRTRCSYRVVGKFQLVAFTI